ncbi:MAG: tyrosine decarboxylase MfnA [Candidatus Bathyarchaeota archaeon]|nr:tyrosine decarboxylase MfnA [Candidatus Bathyarchaeota archaeon]
MQQKGQNQNRVLDELKILQAQNQTYTDGKILCSMCTKPLPIAKEAYQMFLDSNLGDAGLFPGSAELEKRAVKQLASLLGGKESTAGFIVSGGTEANLMAMLAARSKSHTDTPEIILPKSAHFSFTKICNALKIKPVYAGLDRQFRVDPQAVDKLVSKDTIAVVGTAGTVELGAVDPIDALSEIAQKYGLFLHVDAAFGGLVLPFLENPSRFDFQLSGVQSITVDPHKMGMAPVPAGGILFRNKNDIEALKVETPYLTQKYSYTFTGTRSGASAAAVYATFAMLGRDGYRKIVAQCMENTAFLAEKLVAFDFCLVVEPTLNIVAFRSKNTKQLFENLQRKGWRLSYVPHLDCIRIVVMPHTQKANLSALLLELKQNF